MNETLEQLLSRLSSLDREDTIYAAKDPAWTPESRAVAAREPDDGSIPPEAAGLEYLLEVHLVGEVLDWLHRDGRDPTPRELAAAVIHYAEFDSL